MAQITLTFDNKINVSAQKGDIVYYTNDPDGLVIVKVGEIESITTNTLVCFIGDTTARPDNSSFILFSKNNKANLNSLTGYFANITLKNDSTEYAELFSVGTEVFESSK